MRTTQTITAIVMQASNDDGIPPPEGGGEIRGSIGASAFGFAALLVPLLAISVASTLGMGMGSVDNDGLGTPLTSDEVRAMMTDKMEVVKPGDDDRLRTYEEAAEEQALVDVLQGGIRRAK